MNANISDKISAKIVLIAATDLNILVKNEHFVDKLLINSMLINTNRRRAQWCVGMTTFGNRNSKRRINLLQLQANETRQMKCLYFLIKFAE